MKRSFQWGAAIVGAVCAFGISGTQAKAGIDAIRSSDSEVWGSVGADNFNYKESVSSGLPDSEQDWIPSVAAGFSYLGAQDVYLALEGNVNWGNARYNGAYLDSPSTPLTGTTRETITNIDGRIGKGFALDNSVMLMPYAELGYRYWDRNLGYGDEEDYQNFDILGGLMVQVSPVDSLVFSVYGSGGTTFSPKMTTSGTTFDLGSEGMYKVGGKVGYSIADRTELFTTLDYERFSYGQSSVVGGYYEPESTTNETAVRVGLAYRFQ